MKTRREFIQQSLMSGALAALSSGCRSVTNERRTLDAASLNALRSQLAGQLILPADSTYDSARGVFWRNPMTNKRPGLIVRCSRRDDIARSVEFAAQHALPVAVRSGGHSFAGWGTCDDGLVIDLALMNEITIDPSMQTARAGAGVMTAALVAAAGEHNLAPVQGQCPMVGVSGLTMGGGLGWLSGKHGAACDNLLSAEFVTADARTLTASSEENPDLLWALRGGGGNFGIASALTFRLHPIGDVIAGRLSYRFGDARAVLMTFREVMSAAPDELQAVALFRREEGEPRVHVTLCWSGDPAAADRIIQPLRMAAALVSDTVERRPYNRTFGMTGGAPRAFSFVKGSYLQRMSDESIDAVVERYAQAPGPEPALGLDHFMHGAVCRSAPEATAFDLREPGAVHVWISAAWDDSSDEAASITWVDETWSTLQAYSGGRVYANFPGSAGDPAAAYGANYARLVTLKNQYDPSNMFQGNQNIRPTA